MRGLLREFFELGLSFFLLILKQITSGRPVERLGANEQVSSGEKLLPF